MIKSDNLKLLAVALVKAQKNMGAALKDSKNPFFKSKYADLNAIIDAAIPALNEQGIAVLQSPEITAEGNSVIETMLLHESGEFITGRSRVVVSKANDAQSEGSATTYARRYGLQAMVTLKAEDDDGNAASGKTVTATNMSTSQVTVTAAPVTKVNTVTAEVTTKTVAPTTTTIPETKVKTGPWGNGVKKTVQPIKTMGDEY
jgi:hypothetical protein